MLPRALALVVLAACTPKEVATLEPPDPTTSSAPTTTATVDSTSTSTGAAAGTSTGPTTGGSSTTGAPSESSTGTTSVDPVDACLAGARPGDECRECACLACLDELGACDADEGCREIVVCAGEASCGGLECLGPCSDIVGAYGGFAGQSFALYMAYGMCLGQACPGLCDVFG